MEASDEARAVDSVCRISIGCLVLPRPRAKRVQAATGSNNLRTRGYVCTSLSKHSFAPLATFALRTMSTSVPLCVLCGEFLQVPIRAIRDIRSGKAVPDSSL